MYYEIDKYLNMIGYEIQLPDNKYDEIQNSYNAVAEYISNNNELAQDVDCNIYYHGSFATNTVIKPLKGEDFDLDIVVEFDSSKKKQTARQFYNDFLKTFTDGERYKNAEEYRNSVRINYASNNFHFDIMPSVPLPSGSPALYVPDTKKRDWVIRSPKTYTEWFKCQTEKIKGYKIRFTDSKQYLMESEITPVKKPNPYEMTPILIRTVQLLKRMKDVFFKDYEGEREPQSIVITTLAAKYYDGETSVYEALFRIVSKMKQLYVNNNRFHVSNPSYPGEDFTAKWPSHIEYYDNYREYVFYIYEKLKDLLNQNKAKNAFVDLFGQSVFDKVHAATKYDSYWAKLEEKLVKDNAYPNKEVVIKKKERGNA